MELLTVGHSNHSIEAFIALLQKHGVTALADVRSHPYSRYLPHFNQVTLKTTLLNVGIRYVFLGRELGARPSNPTCYVDGKALYEKIASTELFSDGIQRLLKGAETYKIALMCAEKDPITCHRAILVCQHLREFNLDINHILKNGNLETHTNLEERLLRLHGLNSPELSEVVQMSLFSDELFSEHSNKNQSRKDLLREAYKRQGDLIAYTEKQEIHYEKTS
jgi:uncharacterized protein (DUF488 family)